LPSGGFTLNQLDDGASPGSNRRPPACKESGQAVKIGPETLAFTGIFFLGSALVCRGLLPEYTRIFWDLHGRFGTECQNLAAAVRPWSLTGFERGVPAPQGRRVSCADRDERRPVDGVAEPAGVVECLHRCADALSARAAQSDVARKRGVSAQELLFSRRV
jgi:hypothetical protein